MAGKPRRSQSQRPEEPARDVVRANLWMTGEASLLIGALLAGSLLRWLWLDRLAIEHYDEGVYASNLLFGAESGFEFPGRPLYAPPLLPTLIEWLTVVWQVCGLPQVGWLPMLPGLLCGTALIPSVWWTARCWFGPVAGVAAAWLVALSEYHAYYSRTALTDPVLVLFLLWSVHWAWSALGTGEFRAAALAGVFTALAWWTKYNGWLPLAIVISGGACHEWLTARSERNWRRYLQVVGIMSAVAALLWLPVLWDCQSVGGYAAVVANHRGYLQGWSAWWSNWLRQNANLSWYQEGNSLLGVVGSVLAALALRSERLGKPAGCGSHHRWQLAIAAGAVAICLALMIAGFPLVAPLLLGIGVVAWSLRDWRAGRLPPAVQRAGCLTAAWFAGLLLTTPLYSPYPRLCLPLWLAGVLGTAWWWHRVLQETTTDHVSSDTASRSRTLANGCAAALLCLCGVLPFLSTKVWERRDGTRSAARELAKRVADPRATVVYVYADPAMVFQLHHLGFAAAPRGNLRVAATPAAAETLLILGLYVDRLADSAEQLAAMADQLEELPEFPIEPSSLVLLDNDSPEVLRDRDRRQQSWRVFRVK